MLNDVNRNQFHVLRPICLYSSFVNFKNGLVYLKSEAD